MNDVGAEVSYLLERALVLIFFCHPPILFFLNGRCPKRLHVAWVALISFLLGWFLCLPFGIVLVANGHDLPPLREVIVVVVMFSVMSGWGISGAVLLFWAPFVTIFVARSRKIKALMGTVILAAIVLVSAVYVHERNFWRVPGNRLIHHDYNRAFLDGITMKVFEAENDLLKQKLIRRWDLQACSRGEAPKSFAVHSPTKPDWWPSEDILNGFQGYAWVDESEELYRSVWYDPSGERLYVESGDW